MRKTIKNKILISILAMSSINLFASAEVFAVDVTVDDNKVTSHNNQSISDFDGYNFINDNSSNNNIVVSNSTLGNFYGIRLSNRESGDRPYSLTKNNITINSSTITGNIIGNKAASSSPSASNLTLTLKDTTVDSEDVDGVEVVGADLSSYGGNITVNNIKIVLEGNTKINNADVILFRRSTWAIYSVNMSDCEIILRDNADVSTSNLYAFTSTTDTVGGYPFQQIKHQKTTLTLDGWSGTVNSLHDFNIINFNNIDLSKDTMLDVTGNVVNMSDVTININSIAMAGDYETGVNNHFVSWDENIKGKVTIADDIKNNLDTNNYYTADRNNNDGIYATKFNSLTVSGSNTSDKQIKISADIKNSVLTGKFIDESAAVRYNSNQTEDTSSLTIGNGFTTNVATVAGAYAAGNQTATGGVVNISGNNITYDGIVYAGYSESGSASSNTIIVAADTNAAKMTLSGSNTGSDNVLNLAGNATFKAINNFDAINFDKIDWINGGTVLSITNNSEEKALANTNININSLNFAGGAELNAGESMTIISNNNSGKDLGIGTGKGKVDALSNFTAGVTIAGTGTTEVASDGNSVKYTLTEVKHLDQINLVAENRAVAAAFVNQGTDLISDSLNTISRDSNYGVKTFAAVHGNRSKYDVNSDIKINGWSTIVGVGNADKFDNGSEFSWGVFYENGSGNYRTFNEFNNEFFRGDGSLVYNGGGIAARYTNKNGVYTEGSLRAGMLKSDMDNALRDGAGNFYGYESESAYYGAHLGVGKIISLSESSDLDVYGKFFHTYTEGDSFKVANDEFEFDSINSDRLRIGARITSNKENKFSTYYGLAYEYEFNGDADMTAQGLKAPKQSLQGSSVMAEVGFNYQPTPTSPWSFDLNMRGYAGERQGGSFNVQATYTF